MCLGVPGKIIETYSNGALRMAKVDFGGVTREACVEAVPEAKPGDWTIIHAGFALSLLCEADALDTLQTLNEIAAIEDGLNAQESGASSGQTG